MTKILHVVFSIMTIVHGTVLKKDVQEAIRFLFLHNRFYFDEFRDVVSVYFRSPCMFFFSLVDFI